MSRVASEPEPEDDDDDDDDDDSESNESNDDKDDECFFLEPDDEEAAENSTLYLSSGGGSSTMVTLTPLPEPLSDSTATLPRGLAQPSSTPGSSEAPPARVALVLTAGSLAP